MTINEAAANPSQGPRKPFPPWRLKNGVKNATDTELDESVESCERWSWRGVAVLLVGLFLEFAISIWPKWLSASPWPLAALSWASLANLFVFCGVAIEFGFSRMASIRQHELTARARNRLAEATERVANVEMDNGFLQATVAEANERAAKAALESEQIKKDFGWRSLSGDEFARLRVRLTRATGALVVTTVSNDPESSRLAMQLIEAFRAAGWTVAMHACSFRVMRFGISIPGSNDGLRKAVRDALRAAGIHFDSLPVPSAESATMYSPLGPISENGVQLKPNRYAEEPVELYVGPRELPGTGDKGV